MTDLLLFGLLFFGLGLQVLTLVFKAYIFALITALFWLFMAISYTVFPLLIAVFIVLVLFNAYVFIVFSRQ